MKIFTLKNKGFFSLLNIRVIMVSDSTHALLTSIKKNFQSLKMNRTDQEKKEWHYNIRISVRVSFVHLFSYLKQKLKKQNMDSFSDHSCVFGKKTKHL